MSAHLSGTSFGGSAVGRAAASRPSVAVRPGPDPMWVARWLPAVVLTLLDAALTYAWIELGLAAERNPWLASIVETSGPGSAMAVRVAVGLGLVALLGLLARDHAIAQRGLALVTAVLALVLCWHVAGGAMVAFAV